MAVGDNYAAVAGRCNQDWNEMELKLHYAETQLEEAQSALARKVHIELERDHEKEQRQTLEVLLNARKKNEEKLLQEAENLFEKLQETDQEADGFHKVLVDQANVESAKRLRATEFQMG